MEENLKAICLKQQEEIDLLKNRMAKMASDYDKLITSLKLVIKAQAVIGM